MPAPNSKKKVLKYGDREKLTAVRLTEAPGVKVKDVAAALDIHPFMLSRWRKLARAGLLGAAPLAVPKLANSEIMAGITDRVANALERSEVSWGHRSRKGLRARRCAVAVVVVRSTRSLDFS